jgi:hypothetical protein
LNIEEQNDVEDEIEKNKCRMKKKCIDEVRTRFGKTK